MADYFPIDPSIVIEVIDDVGGKETLPHSILPATASTRSIDDKFAQADKGLPQNLSKEAQSNQTSEPHTEEVATTRYRPIAYAVIGGVAVAILAASLLLYVTG